MHARLKAVLNALIERRWSFVCRGSQSGRAGRLFAVECRIGAAADYIPGWFPASMRTVFTYMNGAELFSIPDRIETGLILYSVKQIEQETTEFRDLLIESMAEDMPVETVDWYKSLVPIGAVSDSGDRIVLDLSSIDDGSEPILYFDHECYYQGVADPENIEEYASDYISFLEKVTSEPLKVLQSIWREKADGEFWFPLEVVSR